jgi:hypothetical protein
MNNIKRVSSSRPVAVVFLTILGQTKPWFLHPKQLLLPPPGTQDIASLLKNSFRVICEMSENDDGWETVPKKPARQAKKMQQQDAHNDGEPSGALPWISYIPPTRNNTQFQPFMVLLCGIPGR